MRCSHTAMNNDCWGKVLLFFTTMIFIAPLMMFSIHHHHHHQLGHRHDAEGVFHGEGHHHHPEGPERHHSNMRMGGGPGHPRRGPAALENTGSMGDSSYPNFWGMHERKTFSSCDSPQQMGGAGEEEAPRHPNTMIPPPVHDKFKIPLHTGALTLFGLLVVSFCRPSFCRFKLATYVFIFFILTAAAFLHKLKEHTEQRFDYCTNLATHEFQVYNVMSVSIGPFDAISIVKSPVIQRLDVEARDQCIKVIEQKRDFMLNVVLHVSSLFTFILLGLTITDWKKSMRHIKAQLNEDHTTNTGSGSADVMTAVVPVASADFTLEEQNAQKSLIDDEVEEEDDESASLIARSSRKEPRQVEYIIVETQEP